MIRKWKKKLIVQRKVIIKNNFTSGQALWVGADVILACMESVLSDCIPLIEGVLIRSETGISHV